MAIIGGPGGTPGDNNTELPVEQIESVYIIDGGWLIITKDGTIMTTADEADFNGFTGPIEPLPEPALLDLAAPETKAIGGEIGGSPAGVVLIS